MWRACCACWAHASSSLDTALVIRPMHLYLLLFGTYVPFACQQRRGAVLHGFTLQSAYKPL